MMELGEVVNPHYAFPVVGVILCVLLVFAFGFKSPVQPPSFDSLEEEKKPIPKKRTKSSRSKDVNKVKSQQNGRVGGSPSSKQMEPSIQQQITNNIKSGNKQIPKSEPKNKKTRMTPNSPRQKLEVDMNKIFTEDNAGDGWVQQLSKKERKHRRKEEVANACTINEIDKSSENETWDEQQPIAEFSSCSQESTPSKDSSKQPSKTNKTQNLSQGLESQKTSKKKLKKDINANQNEINACEYEEHLTEEKKSEIKLDLGQYDKPNPSIQINPEIDEESLTTEDKPSKKKKGKKKNQDVNVLVTKPIQNEIIEKDLSKIQNDTDVSDNLLIENTDVENSTIDKLPKLTDENGITESGSNVIFDELGDIWQNPKSQKKKKKARREQ